jgi:hypothetical protein
MGPAVVAAASKAGSFPDVYLAFRLTIGPACYMVGYVTRSRSGKSFPSYHIAATPAVSRTYGLFCATAAL